MFRASFSTFELKIRLGFWAQWVLASVLIGSVVATLFYLGWNFCIGILPAGLLLGGLQGAIIQKYTGKRMLLQWMLASGVGWFAAVMIIFLGSYLALLSSGLNDTDIRRFELVTIAIAGAIFAGVQALFSTLSSYFAWVPVNSFAWAVGGFVGGLIGLANSNQINATQDIDLFSSDGRAAISTGILAGLAVYGVITGLGALGLLERDGNPLGRDSSLEQNDIA